MRTPAPNELEYLDVFDFFNMPRLPVPADSNNNNNNGINSNGQGANVGLGMGPGNGNGEMMGEYNIINYMVPNPESDWLFKANA